MLDANPWSFLEVHEDYVESMYAQVEYDWRNLSSVYIFV